MKRTLSAQHLKVQKGCTEPVTPISLTGQIRPVRLQANHQSAPQACSPDSSSAHAHPVYRHNSILLQILIAVCEMFPSIPFSSTADCQGRRVYRLQHLVPLIVYVNQSLLALCYTSPQHKDDMLTISIQRPDNGIRKTLPLVLPMAVRLILVYGQCRIQQQHPLFSPACKIARKLIGAVKAHPECIV